MNFTILFRKELSQFKRIDMWCKTFVFFLLMTSQLQNFVVMAQSGSRKVAVSLSVRNEPVLNVFKEIQKQTGYSVFYNAKQVNLNYNVTIKVTNEDLNQVLKQLLNNTHIGYSLQGKQILLRVIESKPTETISIKGKVIDNSDGSAVPGASVVVKNSQKGTATDLNGIFSIKDVQPNDTLVISFVGMKTQRVGIEGRTNINVTLTDNSVGLKEVVAIGYGKVNKKDITGSLATVNMETMMKAPVIAFDQALAGRVAGVQVSSNDGQPGSEMNIVIRGQGSVTQSTAPLYVIDGVPMEDPINSSLSPEDIESITVLKDASETAIYGARGANGVIVIETKQGKPGQPVINFKVSQGFENIYKTIDMMSPYDFVKLEQERDPAKSSVYLSDNRDLNYYKNVSGFNWQNELFKTGLIRDYSLSIRGGNDKTKYSISTSITNNDAIVINTGFKRYQGRIKLDQALTDKIKLNLNVNYVNQTAYGQAVSQNASSDKTAINGYLLYSVWGYRPVVGIDYGNFDYDLENELIDEDAYEESGIFTVNPVINAKNTLNQITLNLLNTSAALTYDITKNLTFKSTGAITNRIGKEDVFYNSNTLRGSSLRASNTYGVNGSVTYKNQYSWVNENTLTWEKFMRGHYISAVGGFSASYASSSISGFTAINVPNEELGIDGLDEGTPLVTNTAKSHNTLASFFGRANYRLLSRYYFTLTMRADGSSKFPVSNKWGYFPSAAFAWKMDREKFIKSIDFISEAKLRLTYGASGNNRITNFASYSALNFSDLNSYSYNNQTTQGLGIILGNGKLKWETVKQTNIGYDLGLFKDRIKLNADLYLKITDDMLLNANIPGSSGFTRVYMNIGKIENRGLELTLNTVNIRTKGFEWSTNFNISFNRNKILALTDSELSRFSYINSFTRRMAEEPMYIAQVGEPVALFYGLIWDGNYQYSDFDKVGDTYILKNNIPTNGDVRETIQPGDIKYKDINEDGVIDAFDKTVIGNPMPKHTGGFSNDFSYKGISLGVFFQWSYGNDILNANRIIFEGNPGRVPMLNQYASYIDRWTPENQSNTMYRVNGEGPEVLSSRTIEDGSYIRLKTVSLQYELPKKLTQKVKLNNVRFSVSAQNLYTWTKYSGLDPEVSTNNSVLTPGFDFSAYPHARSIVFAVNLTL